MSGFMKLSQVLILIITSLGLNAQKEDYQYLFKKGEKIITDIHFYGGLTHQHHDFFNKAFSFQGIEAGLIFNHKIMAGIYGSAFASNLEPGLQDKPSYIIMAQFGLVLGYIHHDYAFLHPGFLLNIAYISIKGDDEKMKLFKASAASVDIGGMVLAPQLYAEMNILKWMKIRTGLTYNFYSFRDQSVITKDDLQNISLNFSFLFGKFK